MVTETIVETSLRRFSYTSSKLIESLGREELDPQELIVLIEPDLAVSMRLLKIANSSFFGFSKKIGSVRHAVTLLGTPTVKSIITGIILRQATESGHPKDKNAIDSIWKASLRTAVLARSLAEHNHRADDDQAYLAGLLHNLGDLILVSQEFDESGEITAGELTHQILTHWNFPDELIHAIDECHNSDSQEEQTQVCGLGTILRAARALSASIAANETLEDEIDIQSLQVYMDSCGNFEQLRQVLGEYSNRYQSLAEAMDMPTETGAEQKPFHGKLIGLEMENYACEIVIDLLLTLQGAITSRFYGYKNDTMDINVLIHDHSECTLMRQARCPIISIHWLSEKLSQGEKPNGYDLSRVQQEIRKSLN